MNDSAMIEVDLSVDFIAMQSPGEGEQSLGLDAANPEILTVGTTCWSCGATCSPNCTLGCTEVCGC
jgi:hypothetical protein